MTGCGSSPAGSDAGNYEYLRQQAEQTWAKELRNLGWFGVKDGDSILELGCGPGWITEKLLGAFPRSQLTALDRDAAMLSFGRRRIEATAGARVIWHEANAERTGLPAESFDVVYARFLYHYLADPVAAAVESLRLLKPGGMLVVTDGDDGVFGVTSPEVPELRLYLERVAAERSRKGGDRHRGRNMRNILARAGFGSIEIEALGIDSAETGAHSLFNQFDPAPLDRLAQTGLISTAEQAEMSAARTRFLSEQSAYVLRIFLMFCWRKTPGAS